MTLNVPGDMRRPLWAGSRWQEQSARYAGNGKRRLKQNIGVLPPQAEENRDRQISEAHQMIRKLKSGKYRLYSRKKDPKTGKRKNLGTFDTREAAEKHERAVQYFKRH
jgi:hypothetical protein